MLMANMPSIIATSGTHGRCVRKGVVSGVVYLLRSRYFSDCCEDCHQVQPEPLVIQYTVLGFRHIAVPFDCTMLASFSGVSLFPFLL